MAKKPVFITLHVVIIFQPEVDQVQQGVPVENVDLEKCTAQFLLKIQAHTKISKVCFQLLN